MYCRKRCYNITAKEKIVDLTDSVSQLNENQGEVNNDMTNKDKEILILKEDIANIMNEKLEVDEKLATSETKLVDITQELEKTKNNMLLSHRKSSELETRLNEEITKLEKEILQKETNHQQLGEEMGEKFEERITQIRKEISETEEDRQENETEAVMDSEVKQPAKKMLEFTREECQELEKNTTDKDRQQLRIIVELLAEGKTLEEICDKLWGEGSKNDNKRRTEELKNNKQIKEDSKKQKEENK